MSDNNFNATVSGCVQMLACVSRSLDRMAVHFEAMRMDGPASQLAAIAADLEGCMTALMRGWQERLDADLGDSRRLVGSALALAVQTLSPKEVAE